MSAPQILKNNIKKIIIIIIKIYNNEIWNSIPSNFRDLDII